MGEVTKTIATVLVGVGAFNWGFTAIGSWASLDAGEPPYPRTTPFHSYLIGSYGGGEGAQAGVNVIFLLVGLASILFLFMTTPFFRRLWPALSNDPSMVYKVIRLLTVVLVIVGGINWLATGLAAVFDPDTSGVDLSDLRDSMRPGAAPPSLEKQQELTDKVNRSAERKYYIPEYSIQESNIFNNPENYEEAVVTNF